MHLHVTAYVQEAGLNLDLLLPQNGIVSASQTAALVSLQTNG